MPNFEGTRRQKLEWLEARMNQWVANAAAIGVLPATATNVKNAAVACRTEFNDAEFARAAAKNATLEFYTASTTMNNLARDVIATIKAYAESTNNPSVYALASIDPPAPPTPVPAPGVPTDFNGSVSPGGVVTLTWKSTPSGVASGVFFLVERKRSTEPAWIPMGGSAEKAFIDPNPMLSSGIVQYRVKAVRGESSSDWSAFISFDLAGMGGVGGSVVGVLSFDNGEQAQAA